MQFSSVYHIFKTKFTQRGVILINVKISLPVSLFQEHLHIIYESAHLTVCAFVFVHLIPAMPVSRKQRGKRRFNLAIARVIFRYGFRAVCRQYTYAVNTVSFRP